MIRLESRSAPSRVMTYASPLLALALTAVLAAWLFVALDKDPVRGLSMFFIEPLNGLRQTTEVLLKATPLVLCALGLAVCYRSNVWNIGAEGQFLLGAVFAGGAALALAQAGISAPRGWLSPVLLLAGVVGGMVWAGMTALLRDRFNASEILVSLMLVYVAQQLLNYLVFGPWKDPQGFNFPQTPMFDASTWLVPLARGMRLHWGAVVALVAVLVFWVFLFRSWRGYQLQVGGACARGRTLRWVFLAWITVDGLADFWRHGRIGRRDGSGGSAETVDAARVHRLRFHRHHRGFRRTAASLGDTLVRGVAVHDPDRRSARAVPDGHAQCDDRRIPGPAARTAADLRHLDRLPFALGLTHHGGS